MGFYTVKTGDYVARIAEAHGIANWRTVWDHPFNQDLRAQRDNPDVLVAGDQVWVPEAEPRTAQVATGKTHFATVKRPRVRVRLRIRDLGGKPVADQDGAFKFGATIATRTDKDGIAEGELPARHDEEAVLELPGRGLKFQLIIGGLDPIESAAGQKQRLNNLGYFAGFHAKDQPGAADERQLQWAVEEFQCDHGLKITGKIEGEDKDAVKTREKLEAEHGS